MASIEEIEKTQSTELIRIKNHIRGASLKLEEEEYLVKWVTNYLDRSNK
jgi:hypothetical protein